MKNTLSAGGLLLVFGYAMGQGSAFLLQLIARASDPQVAGEIVLYLSLFSICFQFADFGNSTLGVRFCKENDSTSFHAYLAGRALIALPVVAIAVHAFIPVTAAQETIYVLMIALPVSAALFSLVETARLEEKGNYLSLSVVQTLPWLLTVAVIYVSLLMRVISFEQSVMIWVLIPVAVLMITKSNILNSVTALSIQNLSLVMLPLAILAPAILSQLWAREMLIQVTDVVGIENLGPLGLARSVQVAGCVVIGFLLRPMVSKFSGVANELTADSNLHGKLVISFVWMSVLSCLPILMILHDPFRIIPTDIARWTPVLLGVPIWGVTIAYISINQARLSGFKYCVIECFGLLVNICIFTMIVSVRPEWAFPAADLARLCFLHILSKYLYDFK